ncbi:MAG: glycoside hydrolase family 88 protein [Paramuribaculum sp.]|nr:glycoside hydrolase family 88 protein [Paramuribaculum sp.]
MNKTLLTSIVFGLFAIGAAAQQKLPSQWEEKAVDNARQQMGLQIKAIESDQSGRVLNPVTVKADRNTTAYCRYDDWRSGFFPGSMWYLYELTGDESLVPLARKYTEAISEAQFLTWHHDIGFIINCSFGNGRRHVDRDEYEKVIVQAARSLCSRFRPGAGVIQSWNVDGNSWQAQRGWICPVIIDNMMNLELLFEATEITGDSTYYNVAVSHADRTMAEHFRPDGSCYHVIDYDPESGKVLHRNTAQGYADESAWSRGQSWAVYGFTVCYRKTGDRKYLDQAVATLSFMKNHASLPSDGIPYWDMDAPGIPDEPRDVSSAAVLASSLYELCGYSVENPKEYRQLADRIMMSLASDEYTAKPGENGRFILMHSVGSIPHKSEIDVPLNYADYYYLEALLRRRNLDK